MSRRDKKRIGNPTPKKSKSWFADRALNSTAHQFIYGTDESGTAYKMYPVGRMKKLYRKRSQ